MSYVSGHKATIQRYHQEKRKQITKKQDQQWDIPCYSTATIIHIAAAAAKSLQSCPTLCNPIDGSPPGSPIPGILQARTLEWAAISFSKA